VAEIERRKTDLARADEMSIHDVIAQVHKVQELMRLVMREGEHYGVIPGTDKPTLLKPGAEKLCLTFRLNPDYPIAEKIETPELVTVTVKCVLTHIPTGQVWASGLGSCNSREKKYRWIGVPMDPQPTWNEQEQLKAAGKGFRKKINGKWMFMERVENDNAFEFSNTITKMAAKRALIAAVLNATAASDIFTQDMEDDAAGAATGAPAAPLATTETVASVVNAQQTLAAVAPDLWGDEVFMENVRRRFSVNDLNELTESQAHAILDGAEAYALSLEEPEDDSPITPDEVEEAPPESAEQAEADDSADGADTPEATDTEA